MRPEEQPNGNVKAVCPACETPTQFQITSGQMTQEHKPPHSSRPYSPDLVGTRYALFRCTACGRGAYAEHTFEKSKSGTVYSLHRFLPVVSQPQPLPATTPTDIVAEFREAELCAAAGAQRAAAALARSALEKTLKANGYRDKMGLKGRLALAGKEDAVTKAHVALADEHARTLANDVLHEEKWKQIKPEETEKAIKYVAWIIRDFYEAREEIEKILRDCGRLKDQPAAADTDASCEGTRETPAEGNNCDSTRLPPAGEAPRGLDV